MLFSNNKSVSCGIFFLCTAIAVGDITHNALSIFLLLFLILCAHSSFISAAYQPDLTPWSIGMSHQILFVVIIKAASLNYIYCKVSAVFHDHSLLLFSEFWTTDEHSLHRPRVWGQIRLEIIDKSYL